ncbi:MAG: LysM peptidoglycan-binding domain-containing protein [Planctomycetota bacterium]
MRQGWVWAVLCAAFQLLASCAKPVEATVHEDVLVLEVGGQQASLREALRALGREVGPGHRLRPAEPEVQRPVATPRRDPAEARRRPEPQRQPEPQPDPRPVEQPPGPAPEPESEWVVVELKQNETLIHVARRHLGSGTRWNEIVAWNGFTAPQLKRLQIGQPIKLKRSELK